MSSGLCQTFLADVIKSGTAVELTLPFDPAAVWGARERYDIAGTIAGRAYRGRILSQGSTHVLRMGAAWWRDNPVTPGMQVEVVINLEGTQVAQMAADLADALQANPAAQAFFENLPTYYRKNYLRWIDGAKQPATRAKRIAELIVLLSAGMREKPGRDI